MQVIHLDYFGNAMRVGSFLRAVGLGIFLSVALVTVSGCGQLFHKEQVKKPKKKKSADVGAKAQKQTISAAEYLQLVTLAQAAVQAGTDAEEYAPGIRQYCAQAVQGSQPVRIVMLEYRDKESGTMRKLAAPADVAASGRRALAEIIGAVEAKATLHEVRMMNSEIIECAPPEDASAWNDFVAAQAESVIDRAAALEPMEEVKQQLALIGFFTDHRFRDAAYLGVDYVKRELARLSQGGGNTPSVRGLSRQLEVQEERLRKEIPFTL